MPGCAEEGVEQQSGRGGVEGGLRADAEDAGKPVLSRELLREMRVLLLEEGHCFRDQALSFCAVQAAVGREVLDASSLATLVQMVGAGIGALGVVLGVLWWVVHRTRIGTAMQDMSSRNSRSSIA